jgi:hypothetical protein
MKEFLKGNYKVDAKIAEAEDEKKSFVWQGEASGVAAAP